ncbi:hypothetical protein I5Q34_09105 [Streptomyces sp. AV19]|uniref:hypothetical protein n=1 Tax=Streptomyces sp. AV19 TaxID=2793068 RepID=UPI0018FEB732|nr:hypothetical protein [Streptomyces sp. AV19]MBH1934444.1 hypothetical protein [Streptomyces sp. AV19]MDG4533234.1 hypothetical protein [Streptomyces sp. AV19]
MRAGTRWTGWATLLAGYATVLLGALPDRELPLKRHLPWLLTATALCGLGWILASVLVRAQRRARLRKKTWRRRHEPWPEPRRSRALSWVLGLGIALTSAAALTQGVGPDGADGEWLSEVGRAGGHTRELRVAKVVGQPETTRSRKNDVEEFSSTIVVTVPFDSGPRQVTVEGVRTQSELAQGRPIELLYAPSRPDLGVRPPVDKDISSVVGRLIALPVIWILTLTAGLSTAVGMHRRETAVARARRFEPWVHLPAAFLLVCGALLVVPLLTGFPDTATGWSLAIGSAATPWLALAWVARTS